MTGYPIRPLGDGLMLDRDEIPVDPDANYRVAGIYSFGRGVFERATISGAETSYKTLFRLHADRLVVSRLNGWEGALDVVQPALDGCVVSGEYPTFRLDASQLESRYMYWLCRWPPLWDRLVPRGSMVRRKRVNSASVLDVAVPMPPIEEQCRIAARLDLMWTKVERLLETTSDQSIAIVNSWLAGRFSRMTGRNGRLGDVVNVVRGTGPTYASGTGKIVVNQACVRWDGLDLSRAREADNDWWLRVNAAHRVTNDDVLVNSTGEGTIGRATMSQPEATGSPFDSHILAVRCDASQLIPAYLVAFLRSPAGQSQIERAKGANTTKQTELGKGKLEEISLSIPSIEEQVTVVADFERMLAAAARLGQLNRERSAMMRALTPSFLNEAFGRSA